MKPAARGWLPRSLFGRNLLLIAVLVVAGQIGSLAFWYTQVQRPRIDRAAAAVLRHADAVRAALDALAPAQRAAYLAALDRRGDVRVGADPPPGALPLAGDARAGDARAGDARAGDARAGDAQAGDAQAGDAQAGDARTGDAQAGDTQAGDAQAGDAQAGGFASGRLRARFARAFFARLRERLGSDPALAWEPAPARRLWLRLPGERGVWLGYSAEGLLPDVSGVVVGLSLLSALLAFAGAALIQRRIDRPLRTLARAAAEVAVGRAPRPLAEDGPAEIAAVAQSFNRMAASLDDAERERALMLAGVSHDLRTPLTKLRLGLEILDDPAEAELIGSMVRSIEAANGIIDQFIDYARIGHDEAAVETDLDALVRRAAQAAAAPDSDVALELAAGLPPVPLRPRAVERLVGNLVQNALRHGRPPVVVRTERIGARAVLTVEDRGPGIPPGQAERLKQPFARLEAARGGAPGAGLGLAIAERVARLHGGALQLRNRPDGGLAASVGFAFAARDRPASRN